MKASLISVTKKVQSLHEITYIFRSFFPEDSKSLVTFDDMVLVGVPVGVLDGGKAVGPTLTTGELKKLRNSEAKTTAPCLSPSDVNLKARPLASSST